MREKMDFDVIIVGAGPAGLSAAIRLAQLSQQQSVPLNICVLEKGMEVGAHLLSGAVLDPSALNQLIPGWQEKGAPLETSVTHDSLLFLTEKKAYPLPLLKSMQNTGNYIISLSQFSRWLANEAEKLGVNILPGFAATEVLFDGETVVGVATGDKGINKDGTPSLVYQAGVELYAKQTIFAEGCRGFLSETLMEKFQLRKHSSPQTYALGIKEIWEIPDSQHKPGHVMHTLGWPLDSGTFGGSFLYHFGPNLLALGLIVGLDYRNPYLNPYEEMQRLKTHPAISSLLQNAKRIAYGARCLNEGGLQAIPKLSFPGGMLVGCAAGFLNVAKLKGIHNAMKSAMVAAESVFTVICQKQDNPYQQAIEMSTVWQELSVSRNIRPAFRYGLWAGLAYTAIDSYLFKGKVPWTFTHKPDHLTLKPANHCKEIIYPKHDNHLTFDLMDSIALSGLQHPENQPCHLKLKCQTTSITLNWTRYQAPEQRYCPAGVYEILHPNGLNPYLQINAANCIHCKACDIKDPSQNIRWTPPEGGSGPRYSIM